MQDETVWLTQKQMASLFAKDRKTITRHIQNIFRDEELLESSVCSNFEHTAMDNKIYQIKHYNLDIIISIGYRVNSKRGIAFRIWANKIVKEYLLKGFVVNQKRLEYLEKTVQLIDIANRGYDRLEDSQAKDILKVISEYSKALDLLDDYDHQRVKKVKGNISKKRITYTNCIQVIEKLKFNENSNLFALERDNGLDAIIGAIYQTYDGIDVYKSIQEKAANFVYLVVKNHAFIDGNKRIAAALFIYFLNYYNILYYQDNKVIDNNTLTALTLLIAESNPKEKDIIVDLVMNFLVV